MVDPAILSSVFVPNIICKCALSAILFLQCLLFTSPAVLMNCTRMWKGMNVMVVALKRSVLARVAHFQVEAETKSMKFCHF